MPTKLPADPPATTPAKPAEDKFDRFRPVMPQIPGVANARAQSAPQAISENKQRLIQIGAMIVVVAVIVLAVRWSIKSASRKAADSSSSESAVTDAPVPEPPAPVLALNEGPTIAATVEELSKPWAAKKFTFVKPLTQENIDAMVIRLPSGDLWAFSLQEPYEKCELEFVTDLGRIAAEYGYRGTHPMVVNSCNGTVYDPLKVGALGDNSWVRGEIVKGGALRPPISIEVETRGRSIVADRIE